MMRTVIGAEVIAAGTATWQIGTSARQGAGPAADPAQDAGHPAVPANGDMRRGAAVLDEHRGWLPVAA
jgi:hypothetical protein